ncbi:MAG: ATP-binding cassette domain-containing protein [Lachnospiraceae bacterium]|nr:ATP-binding cassette domain-containing protein [Lachnospiraceae bacterium]
MIEARELTKTFMRTLLDDNEKNKKNSRKKGKIRNVKEEFLAVDRISFRVDRGEIVGILGPNGAGKTTLLRMLGNMMEPSAGEVIITDEEGNAIDDVVEKKRNIGYLSGNTKLYHRLSTREMLIMLGEIYGLAQEECHRRIEEIFTVLDMTKFGDNRIERLSTGQTQRASIARCLIHSPSIYIFDEPTLGLDILSADAIIDFMKSQKERGKAVLYSTHYMEEAQFLCDRIIMIHEGHIIAHGTAEKIMSDTSTDNLRHAFHAVMKGVSK